MELANFYGSGGGDSTYDAGLHIGRVIKVHYPDEPTNISKLHAEYDIVCTDTNATNAPSSSRVYYRAKMLSAFGSIADRSTFTPRLSSLSPKDDGTPSDGSYVLFQCIAGDPRNPVVLGGLQPLKGEATANKEDGHNLFVEFNGLTLTIGKDGGGAFVFSGPTKDDGTPVDKNAPNGSRVELKGDSSVLLQSGGDKPQSIHLNATDNKLSISTQGKTELATESLTINSGSEPILRGKAYRDAEDDMLSSINDALQSISTALGIMGVACGAAETLVGVVPPPSPQNAINATVQIGKAVAAIAAFKAKSATFNSKHNVD